MSSSRSGGDAGDDDGLSAWRAQRLAELQRERGAGRPAGPATSLSREQDDGGPQQGEQPQQQQQQEEQQQRKQEAEERRRALLRQILTEQASERLTRIGLVKPDKARAVEDNLLRAAQSGQLQQRATEEQVIQVLGQYNEQVEQRSRVTVTRRRKPVLDDSDDDDGNADE